MEWIPFEVHADTPPEGTLLSDMFPGTDFTRFYPKLAKRSGVPDLPFGVVTRLVNSRLSLKAMMLLRDTDIFPVFHENMFRAHFAEERNISLPETIIDVARASGLNDSQKLEAMLAAGGDPPGFADAVKLSRQFLITGVPAFIINDTHRLVGVQPLEQFRETLHRLNLI
jgi:predicted DsbA family dithiol-disulfide isomerase